jgi:hypothetical protein
MKMKNLAYATCVAVAAVAIVIGSAVPSEAAKKKKAAAAPPPPPAAQWPTCWGAPYGPVCATKGDQKFTYINSCYAMKDQAKSATPGACKAKAAKGGGKKKGKKKK